MTRRFRPIHALWVVVAAALGALVIFAIPRSPNATLGPAGESETALPPAYYVGVKAAEQGDWSAAAVAFEEALEAAPDAPPLLFALGTATIEAGRPLSGALYLSAYLEAVPDAPNATKVSKRIEAIGTIYRAVARNMAAEAVMQLDAIVDSEARFKQARPLVGPLIDLGRDADLKTFASRQPMGVTGAALAHLLARGIPAASPDDAYAVLRAAIDGEAQGAAADVGSVGCTQLGRAREVCSVLSDPARARACYEEAAGITGPTSPIFGNRAAFAGYLDFQAAVHLWLSGGPEPLVRRLAQDHQTDMSAAFDPNSRGLMPNQCSAGPNIIGRPGANFVALANGGIEAWTAEGRIDLARPPPAAAPIAPAAPFHDWRTVVANKSVDVGPERLELAFDDIVFTDLSDAVRLIGREPAAARAERLMALASKLGLLAQRLTPS